MEVLLLFKQNTNIATNLQGVCVHGTINLVQLWDTRAVTVHFIQTLLTLLNLVPHTFHLIKGNDYCIHLIVTQALHASTLCTIVNTDVP